VRGLVRFNKVYPLGKNQYSNKEGVEAIPHPEEDNNFQPQNSQVIKY
jgi:hypothetical protein